MFYTKKEKQKDREDMERYVHNKTEILRSSLKNLIDDKWDESATEHQLDYLYAEISENSDSQFKITLAVAMAAKISPKKLASMFKIDTPEITEYAEKFADELAIQADKELANKHKKEAKKSK